MNLVVLTGRMGAAPEIRTLNSGDRVANFSLATEERWKDRQSGEKYPSPLRPLHGVLI